MGILRLYRYALLINKQIYNRLKRYLKFSSKKILKLIVHSRIISFYKSISKNSVFYGTFYYLDSNINIVDFFLSIPDDLKYTLLRPIDYEDESNVEELDILIREVNYQRFTQLLSLRHSNHNIRIDIHKEGYFPNRLFDEILLRSIKDHNGVCVPSHKYELLSLIWHLYFHKGMTISDGLNNKYANRLIELYNLNQLPINNADSSAVLFLKENELINDSETILLLTINKPNIRALFGFKNLVLGKKELIVFIIREWAVKNNEINEIMSIINEKFFILYNDFLDIDEALRTLNHTRGGNWGHGDESLHGGDPRYIIICQDNHPLKVKKWVSNTFPLLINQNNFTYKNRIRSQILSKYRKTKRAHFIHSSDNNLIALEYIKVIGLADKINTMAS